MRNSLNLSEAEWGVLIERMEAARGPEVPATRDRRDYEQIRHTFVRRAALRIQHPAGNTTTHMVRTRNISCGGLGFVHGAFLYDNTKLHIALQTRMGEGVALAGKVVWSRHIEGQSHEIGVRFAQPIDITEFIEPEEAAKAG